MRRSLNKDNDVASSTPGRRSLRNSKPLEEEVKSSVKVRKYVGKKKEDKAENKNEEGKTDTEIINSPKNNQVANETDGETTTVRPTISRRSGRKRQLSEEAEPEEDDEKANGKKDDKEDEKSDDKKDDKSDDQKEEGEQSNAKTSSELKNGKAEDAAKVKTRKKRRPPTKKKKEEQDESELWTPLESLDDEDNKKDTQRKGQSRSESKRKQALVERQAPADPMLQKQPPRHRRTSGGSECEVLVSVPRTHRRSKQIVTVDIDDEASETGSIQIVAEPDVDSVFDFKRLLIQYRNVNLPSSLWGVHKDPRKLFVSFTRFNPDFPDTNGMFVDRAVVFKGSLNPEAFVNGEKLDLPEMFNVVETIYEASQVIEFVNNTVVSITLPPNEPSDENC